MNLNFVKNFIMYFFKGKQIHTIESHIPIVNGHHLIVAVYHRKFKKVAAFMIDSSK